MIRTFSSTLKTLNSQFTQKCSVHGAHKKWKKIQNASKARAEENSQQLAAYSEDPNSQIGNAMPLSEIRIATWVHTIESVPGQGPKIARSPGAFAKIIKEPGAKKCLLRLPSGVEKLVDSRCRAIIGVGSNPNYRSLKLYKAGQNRWLGIRPHVRGVAMNPVDHPHGGGEGRTSGGRSSCSPWGKPTKCGYRSAKVKKRKAAA
ncbi:hypothetical protein IFM89_034025 [Coptis chinensis]|uniref:Large ribosomal subunit protein uL2 C-terminal domain-containing protein n=1 Tax=Coptis chinensis TaxID=261450 RepID=A0A835IPL9_9MAGN|nr:hypothetical protein IFM89_034025 [Coptis chinensis]